MDDQIYLHAVLLINEYTKMQMPRSFRIRSQYTYYSKCKIVIHNQDCHWHCKNHKTVTYGLCYIFVKSYVDILDIFDIYNLKMSNFKENPEDYHGILF